MTEEERRQRQRESQRKAQAKWNAANLERITLSFKRGHRAGWERAAAAQGVTMSAWIISTLDAAAAAQAQNAPQENKPE